MNVAHVEALPNANGTGDFLQAKGHKAYGFRILWGIMLQLELRGTTRKEL